MTQNPERDQEDADSAGTGKTLDGKYWWFKENEGLSAPGRGCVCGL